MITEDYVSFEVAKLLKDKGFDEICDFVYDGDKLEWIHHKFIFLDGKISTNSTFNTDGMVSAPTLQMTMKWLREAHRIETHIALSELNADNSRKYMFDIFSSDVNRVFDSIQEYGFNSYEETCEAAIKYCLENLI